MYINEFKWKESEDKETKDLKKDKVKKKKSKEDDIPKPRIRRCVKCKSAPTKVLTLGGKDFCTYCYEELRRKDRKLFNEYVNIDLKNSNY